MPVLTKAQVLNCQKGQACANNCLLDIEWLEKMAEVYPEIREAVQDLRTRRDYLAQACETALEMHRVIGE